MKRTRIKICGLTTPQDAVAAAHCGVDALGLVLYPPSPRALSIAAGRAVAQALPPFVSLVCLFVNPSRSLVDQAVAELRPHMLQFHGEEDRAQCEYSGLPYLKVLRPGAHYDVATEARRYPSAAGILLDSPHPSKRGGSGQSFDWSQVGEHPRQPLLLAGGLNVDNVTAALEQLHPYGIDVSSSVESAPGRKDAAKIAALCAKVRQYDMGA